MTEPTPAAPTAELAKQYDMHSLHEYGILREVATPPAAATPTDARDAARYRHLMANCISDDDGWANVKFATNRLRSDHDPDCAYWIGLDIDAAMGATPAAATPIARNSLIVFLVHEEVDLGSHVLSGHLNKASADAEADHLNKRDRNLYGSMRRDKHFVAELHIDSTPMAV